MKQTGYLQSTNGAESSMRLVFVYGMIWAMIITTVAIFTGFATFIEGGATFCGIAGVFLGSKLWQNKQENKSEEIENK